MNRLPFFNPDGRIDRRGFIRGLLASTASFFILPGAGRVWVPQRTAAIVPVTEADFIQFLIDQQPKLDELIMQDMKPTDCWLYNVEHGEAMGTPFHLTDDKFTDVWPNFRR